MTTSIMPKEIKDKWIAALRSGEYKQAKHVMFDKVIDGGGYCCLGVLQHCISGKIVKQEMLETPSRVWLAEHNINFYDGENTCSTAPVFHIIDDMGEEVEVWATVLNDDGKSFEFISHLIEEQIEGI